MRKFDSVAAWPGQQVQGQKIPPGQQVETVAPSREASFSGDVLVPASQAGLSGILVGGLATFAAWRLGVDRGDLLTVFLGVVLVVAVLVWAVLLRESRRLLWMIERAIGKDLDGDRRLGRPAERLVLVNGPSGQQVQAQQERQERRSDFARFVSELPVKGTNLRAWERDLGRKRYCEYRDVLIRCGWAAWTSPGNERQGWTLTASPDEVLERVSG